MKLYKQIRRSNSGITLLEIMVVLAIMALIVGLVAPRVMGSFGRAKTQAASIQMNGIKGALQLYYIDVGRYPTEADNLAALLNEPAGVSNWRGPYLDSAEDIQDPWGRPYFFRFPGQDKAFDLFSYGRDGRAGGTREDSDINL